ncbi:unnamed protein product [Cyprideis torosa]|uniref:Carbonic anhydrase n=1 Tax=Cyprideis torosa TaxID=163714 RepID=A0A7R8ZMP7_9CRUS|nr:unnamed protein product [Cyprideis torosa]CAG0884909.1 unnamed protein product [Cyprideis torosa]
MKPIVIAFCSRSFARRSLLQCLNRSPRWNPSRNVGHFVIDQKTKKSKLDWGYCLGNGPATWSRDFPAADGDKQSPVDILESDPDKGRIVKKEGLPGLTWTYSPVATPLVMNTGQGWRLLTSGLRRGKPAGVVSGGPLSGEYQLEQIHMHWGSTANEGSEHTIDSEPYCGEVHLVHYNAQKYTTFDEAVDKPYGLAVLGVLLKVDNSYFHPELQKVAEAVDTIMYRGMKTDLFRPVDPERMIPGGPYWSYEGSLTQPPCFESVHWIVFKEHQLVHPEQLEAFRRLRMYAHDEPVPDNEFGGKVLANWRPTCPLGERTILNCGCSAERQPRTMASTGRK